jgi:hypothetical protein
VRRRPKGAISGQSVRCGLCGVDPGAHCIDASGRRTATHAARWWAIVDSLDAQVGALTVQLQALQSALGAGIRRR